MNPVRRTRRSGFTFAELLASMTVMSVLMLGMSSAILIAGKALPEVERASTKLIRETQFADEFSMDLEVAVHITERTARSIAFTVADRDGDGSPERFRYAWSGTAGGPVTRQYNGGSVTNVLEDVYSFGLAYDIEALTEEYPGPMIEVEGAEQLLSSYDPPDDPETWQLYKFGDPGTGQYFLPTLPPDADKWRLTRVRFTAKSFGNVSGRTKVSIVVPDEDKMPTGEVLANEVLWESSLSAGYTWQEFQFADLPPVMAGDGLCLVLKAINGNDAALSYEYFVSGPGLVWYSWGGSWIYEEAESLRYYTYGRVTVATPGPPQTATRQYVTRVRMALQVGDDSSSHIDTSVRTLNTPEVLSAVWELNFDTDPTTLDMNGDGLDDWGDGCQRSLDPDNLENGIWYAPNRWWGNMPMLNTVPNESFTELTTVVLRFRATSVGGGWGSFFRIYADRHDGSNADLWVSLSKPVADAQELSVGYRTPSDEWPALASYNVKDDFVNVRLVIDPDAETIALFVEGLHKDTFDYPRNLSSIYCNKAAAWLFSEEVSSEWDHVSIRVGGNN